MATARRAAATSSRDRKSTRLNSSHLRMSYAVFCLKKNGESQYVQTARLERVAHYLNSYLTLTLCVCLRGESQELEDAALERGAHFVTFFLRLRRPPKSTLFPYRPLSR